MQREAALPFSVPKRKYLKIDEVIDANEKRVDRRRDEVVRRQSVNAIETGKYDPSLPLAFRIAALFELPIEAIFSNAPE